MLAKFTCCTLAILAASQASFANTPISITVPDNNGMLINYVRQVYEALGERTGIEFEVHVLPGKRAILTVNQNRYNGVSMRVINLEKNYPKLNRVKAPIFTVQHLIFSPRKAIQQQVTPGNFVELKAVLEQNDYVIGFMRDSKKANDALADISEAYKYRLDSSEQGFRMLEKGRIDALLAGPGIVGRSIYNRDYRDTDIREVGVFAEFPLYPYFHNDHVSLIPTVEAALQNMQKDGSLQAIRSQLESQ